LSNQNYFIIFHVLVLTTVLDHSQVVTIPKMVIRESMYPNWVPRNTLLICIPGTDKTNPFHSCQGIQVPIQTWALSPRHLRLGLSAVLRTPPRIHP
jgi:hypothetical protein